MTAISAHQGKGKGQENWYSCAPLWVCVAHHDFHSLCVCAPGYSIISFSCCISPSCVAIRVHCRIPICPHMAQKLLISLLHFFPEPEASIILNSQWSLLGRHCSELTKVSVVICLLSAVLTACLKNRLAPWPSLSQNILPFDVILPLQRSHS